MDLILVDDHVVLRQLLIQALNQRPGWRVTGEASSVEEGLALCRQCKPDLVVLDLNLGNETGLDLLKALKKKSYHPRILVFTGVTNSLVLMEALWAGAAGIVEKTGSLALFTEAIDAVAQGKRYLGPVVTDILRQFQMRPNATPDYEPLTAREREVLALIAKGMTNKEAAAKLGVSVHTVENHRANMMRKTGCQTAASLTVLAVRLGLIETA